VRSAFERGINLFYWGSMRRRSFGKGLRTIAEQHREEIALVIQSYTRIAALMERSLDSALRRLRFEYADLLLLGWWNAPPPERILDAARSLIEAGKARHILVSCHHRPTFREYIDDSGYGAIMVRYNAAHTGAETEVFPHLDSSRPGVVSYTATRWGTLLDPRRTPAGEATPTATDCYRFVLNNPSVDVCMAGPADADQLQQALAALDRGPMTEEELAWMRRVGASVREQTRSGLRSAALKMMDRVMGAPRGSAPRD
jgi:aryl-alcohol dehydrogenase-like predicted oxidoreductase